MKRRILSIVLLVAMCTTLLAGCGQKSATWKVTCPWAPSGVAAMVSQQAGFRGRGAAVHHLHFGSSQDAVWV